MEGEGEREMKYDEDGRGLRYCGVFPSVIH